MPETAVATSFTDKLTASREAARALATATTAQKNTALRAIADAVLRNQARVLQANELDLANGRDNGLSAGLQDRLRLDEKRLIALSQAVLEIVALPDPVGDVVRGSSLENGLQLTQIRVPFGVVGAIYEARPNVTIDIAALALKSGNAVVLRGGTAAENTNRVLVDVIQSALGEAGLPIDSVQTTNATSPITVAVARDGRMGGAPGLWRIARKLASTSSRPRIASQPGWTQAISACFDQMSSIASRSV